ncbi:type II secretion system F family protein [Jatrophihabitans telluris]|uniref:Type II secretion system F family protein n=1 Tax=Jatrophihabitans telluris TaxID=2038343 RepID=A0ABY4R2Y2_9ACTN|nr:type II secretion system F family protein [Jatrophihabitans telluris]UQX89505.1 type II secretion system F family protein [Jatrophihabitans telluris]
MSAGWTGALLGFLVSAGLILAVRAAPPSRPIRLIDRVAPYVGDTPAPSKLLARPPSSKEPFAAIRRLAGPAVSDAVRWVDRLVGGSESVRRRLGGLASTATVEDFRVEQIIWGVAGTVSAGLLALLALAARGSADVVLVLIAAGIGAAAGVLARDWWLSRQLERREQAIVAEFPVVADLLALSVIAGEAPVDAVQRVCRLAEGELTHELGSALDAARAGAPITQALHEIAQRSTVESVIRFLDGLIVAIERGTPLAEVIRAQAADVREEAKRELLEAGSRKEIQMMAPVVFLILPVTILFALYPGLLTLSSLAS